MLHMQRHSKTRDSEHRIWCIVRGPFHRICCRSFKHHTWERFDYDRAGCLKCGTLHWCGSSTVNSGCPLETTEDGSVCCTLTGFCVPTVRYSDCEYVERFDPDLSRANSRVERRLLRSEALFEHVRGVVFNFLLGKESEGWRKQFCARNHCEIERGFARFCVKWQKSCPGKRPCVHTVLASTLHALKLRPCVVPSRVFVSKCSERILKCLVDIGASEFPRAHVEALVIGLLYLMPEGVACQNKPWLERCPEIQWMLPPVSVLSKTFGISSKVLCTTENEVKLALRGRAGIL